MADDEVMQDVKRAIAFRADAGYTLLKDCADEAAQAYRETYAASDKESAINAAWAKAKAVEAAFGVIDRYSKFGLPWFPWETINARRA